MNPVKRIGIFTADLMTIGGSSRKGCLLAQRLSRRHEVWLISRDRPDVEALRRSFGASLQNVRFLCLGERRFSVWDALTPLLPQKVRNIVEQFAPYQRQRRLKLDLFIHNTSSSYMKAPAPRAIFMCMFPWPMPKFPQSWWCHLPLLKQMVRYALAHTLNRFPFVPDTYDLITANSEFTAAWIKRLWNKDARIVYSATQLIPCPTNGPKEKIILNVGRYNSDKMQHVLVDAFRGMSDLHEAGWELHLAGKIAPTQWSHQYHDMLRESARGYPVVFHYDPSLEELHRLYERSSIFWNAKGFGAPDDEPQRLEHFGNTPLEAMSAGCVPVVLDAGGMRETVQHGVNGFRWRTVEEMQEQTRRLVRSPELLAQFRVSAMTIDRRFGVEPFLDGVEAIVDEVLALDR